jgi:PhnB protein
MNIPPGFTTVFPYIFASNPDRYLKFLELGLGGDIQRVDRAADGSVRNAQVRFGDTTIMVCDAQDWGEPTRATYYLYVDDADAAMSTAVAAGGVLRSAVKTQPYGDRQGGVTDPSGNVWWLSQHLNADGY